MQITPIIEALTGQKIAYAILDNEEKSVRILIASDKKGHVGTLLKQTGFKRIKDNSGDEYLYGMDHFEYFSNGESDVTLCCQVACRSTLNGEWVPLDRIINVTALDQAIMNEDKSYFVLNPVDEICYLLAKSVYTDNSFAPKTREKLSSLLAVADRPLLAKKLELVFFGFSEIIIQYIEDDRYDDIYDDFWSFAEY